MSIRIPEEIKIKTDSRISDEPLSNKILIISENCNVREDFDKQTNIFGLHTAVSILTTAYYELKQFYDTVRIGRGQDRLKNLEFIFEKSIKKGLEKLEVNPFGFIIMGHGAKDSLSIDEKEWINYLDFADFINNKRGDILMLMLPICYSFQFGNKLEKETEKVIIMDARYSNLVGENDIFCDGDCDSSRGMRDIQTLIDWQKNISDYILTESNILELHYDDYCKGLKNRSKKRDDKS